MSNYTLNNVRRFITHIDETDYWDMHVNMDCPGNYDLSTECLSAFIDFTNPECVSGNQLTSLAEYSYPFACNHGLKLENIGYTGVDNGLITYQKDRITNEQFYDIYTKSLYEIESGDTRLYLHKIGGNTSLYDYPTSINEDGSIKLNGGFYQGFFRSGNEYSVLPSYMEPGQEWNIEFVIRKVNYGPESNKTLNDTHPDNKGIFFYLGTRAENKWIYLYDNIPLSGTSYGQCEGDDDVFDLISDEMPLSSQTFNTTSGFDLNSPNDEYFISDNKFLIFSRVKSGVTISNYEEGDVAVITSKKRLFDGNLFLYMNRSCSGYTVNDINQLESGYTDTYDSNVFYHDIYSNAIAFLIKDDGSIGYKYLVKNCDKSIEKPYNILEGYSYPGIINENEWVKIKIRIKAVGKDGMKLMFYVNGKLKYITSELPIFNFKELDELPEKQEGVSYNISIGGGSQGLSEAIFMDYMLYPTKIFPIEENFAGSFIGDIKTFKFYAC